MPHATYPKIYFDGTAYQCEMMDKRTGKVWGYGSGATRHDAIAAARVDQPKQATIKRMLGWVTRHPFLGGFAVGAYLGYRWARDHHDRVRLRDLIVPGIALGTVAWVGQKIVKAFFGNRQSG